ncbi:MAG: metal ABC transporter permease [Moraxella osloensis]
MVLGIMGIDGKNRNSVVGILLPFGLGLGVLFLSLYQGRSANKFGLLTGQIVAITPAELQSMLVVAVIVRFVNHCHVLVSACYLPQLTRKLPKHSI